MSLLHYNLNDWHPLCQVHLPRALYVFVEGEAGATYTPYSISTLDRPNSAVTRKAGHLRWPTWVQAFPLTSGTDTTEWGSNTKCLCNYTNVFPSLGGARVYRSTGQVSGTQKWSSATHLLFMKGHHSLQHKCVPNSTSTDHQHPKRREPDFEKPCLYVFFI